MPMAFVGLPSTSKIAKPFKDPLESLPVATMPRKKMVSVATGLLPNKSYAVVLFWLA